jgi:hypothetical protein
MKKTLLLLIATLFLTACSSDDDGGSSNSIIGTWKITERDYIDENGVRTTVTPSECTQNSRSTFNEDGTYIETYFYEVGNDCIQDDEIYSSNWEIINDNILRITNVDGDNDYLIIENTGNTLRIKDGELSENYYEVLLERVN